MKKYLLVLLLLLGNTAFAAQNVVIVVDDSGSMSAWMGNTTRIEAAKTALKQTITSLPNDARVGIVSLNGGWQPDQWLVPFNTINKKQAMERVDLLRDSGGTPLGGAMKVGCDVLLADREKNGYGLYTLLVVTDGEATDGSLMEQYVDDIKSRGIIIDAIGVGMSEDHSLATKVHAYRRADDPESLTKAISATFAETSVADKSAAEEDFALVSALPDGAAPKIIDALAKGNNTPIGEKPQIVLDDAGNVQFDNAGNVVTAPAGGSFPIGWILGALLAIVVLVLIVGIIIANS